MKRLLLAFLLILGLAACAQAAPPDDALELVFLDVGQGDAILIQAPNGKNILIDGGPYQDRALELLKAKGVTGLELVIASHNHADHIDGLAEVIAYYQPEFFMDNGVPATSQTYAQMLAAVQAAGSRLLEPTQRTISLGDVTLHILPPPGDATLGQNNNSVGVTVEYGDFKASLTGDSEGDEWHYWESLGLLEKVTVHKSSHHGSENGDIPLTMSRLHPEVVVISVGEGNSYGHPSESALRLYRAIGADIYRTDLQGTITVRATADGSYQVTTEHPATDHPAPAPIPTPLPTPEPSTGRVVIRCVYFDPSGPEDGKEWVSLYAHETTDVSGWRLEDEANHAFSLSGILEAGATYQVRNPGEAVWNNSGDTASLYDAAGALVDTLSYSGSGIKACR